MPFLHVSQELKASERRRPEEYDFYDLVQPKLEKIYEPFRATEEEHLKWQADTEAAKKKHEQCLLMYATNAKVIDGGDTQMNYLIKAFHMAYNRHGVVVLSPSIVLSALQSVVGTTIGHHAEEMRDLFVEHKEGKKNLVVILATPIGEYSLPKFMHLVTDMLKGELKVDYPLTSGFTTDTAETRLANVVQTMASFKEYFGYGGICMCGYRGLKLEGTPDDWTALDAKFKATRDLFRKLGDKNPLERWCHLTQQVIDRFVHMASLPDGSQLPDDLVRFVNSAYVECPQGSGGDFMVSGWLGTTLAPCFDNEGNLVLVNDEGERSFFDPSVPVPSWDNDKFQHTGYSKQDEFIKRVREWSGNLLATPQAYTATSNQVNFELNDHEYLSTIDLVAGIGGVSVEPCKELADQSYEIGDENIKYLVSRDKVDGKWQIPEGYVLECGKRGRVVRRFTRTVSFDEFRPQILVRMIATLQTEAEVTAEHSTKDADRKRKNNPDYVKQWIDVYSRAAKCHRGMQ